MAQGGDPFSIYKIRENANTGSGDGLYYVIKIMFKLYNCIHVDPSIRSAINTDRDSGSQKEKLHVKHKSTA
ncbi:hypothetical protein GCM10011502_19980 [Oceanisphaera marina]|uniref:Uncharacterized protein n=1 Tax=Oceanisphaera marina TaxID=2017550 RepID=A0ABQ1INI5_9GAMM|nr:hypothetical protein GCM10011502_19980 [Oceanisphaera marina]